MTPSELPPLVLHGWYALHQLFHRDEAMAPDPAGALEDLFTAWGEPGEAGWSGAYNLIGGSGGHLLALHLRPSLAELSACEMSVRRAASGGPLRHVQSYLSVVELGLYSTTLAALEDARTSGISPGTPDWEALAKRHLDAEAEKRHARHRLFPVQPPELPWISVYPMERRRTAEDNWYLLPIEERAGLMADHGRIGRRYAGRLSQIISGCTGLDDSEWIVTLFAADPLVFKEVVTEMRYAESTARYAEFGEFWTGVRLEPGELAAVLRG